MNLRVHGCVHRRWGVRPNLDRSDSDTPTPRQQEAWRTVMFADVRRLQRLTDGNGDAYYGGSMYYGSDLVPTERTWWAAHPPRPCLLPHARAWARACRHADARALRWLLCQVRLPRLLPVRVAARGAGGGGTAVVSPRRAPWRCARLGACLAALQPAPARVAFRPLTSGPAACAPRRAGSLPRPRAAPGCPTSR